MHQICITGATGVLGVALLKLGAPSESRRWHIILRAKDNQHLDARAERLCQRYSLNRRFCTFYRGDVTRTDFGLSAASIDRIINQCTHYIHAAGQVKLNLPKEEAMSTAVQSARTILEWFNRGKRTGPATKMVFLSTVGVAGRTQGLIPEVELINCSGFHNTYERAKYEAEKIICANAGTDIVVVRPSMIVGDQHTGEVTQFQVFYHLADFFAGLKTDGVLPELGQTQLDTIPVNVVATAILELLDNDPARGKGFIHLASGPKFAPSLSELTTIVRRIYHRHGLNLPQLNFLPVDEYTQSLPKFSVEISRHRDFHIGLHFILPYLVDKQTFANDTLMIMRGGKLPAYTDYLEPVLNFYLGTKVSQDCGVSLAG